MNANQLLTKIDWFVMNSNTSPIARETMRQEALNLRGALSSKANGRADDAHVGKVFNEALRVARMYGVIE